MNSRLPKLTNVLLSQDAIEQMIAQLAAKIQHDYTNRLVLMIPIMNGALRFSSCLIAQMDEACLQYEPITVQSYDGVASLAASLEMLRVDHNAVAGKHVLLVDDIWDTGQTLHEVTEVIRSFRPASIEHVVMLVKQGQQLSKFSNAAPKYTCFEIENRFVVGMGLDYRGFYRNLPYIAEITPPEREAVDQMLADLEDVSSKG